MALYPQTTCFYKAVIHEPPSRVSKYFSRTKAVTPDLQSTQFRYDDRVITCQGYCILQFWSNRTKRDIMKRSKEKSSMDRRYSKFSRTNWYLHANLDKLRASWYERGQPGWLGVRDLASPLFSSQKFSCVHMRSRVAPVTDISVFATEISATGETFSHMNTPTRVTGTKPFLRK